MVGEDDFDQGAVEVRQALARAERQLFQPRVRRIDDVGADLDRRFGAASRTGQASGQRIDRADLYRVLRPCAAGRNA